MAFDKKNGVSMLTQPEIDIISQEVLQLLANEGVRIESPKLTDIMVKKGCTLSPSGRVRIPKPLVDELVAFLEPTREKDARDQELHHLCGVDWAHHILWNNREDEVREQLKTRFMMSAFDCGPTTYYDYREQKAKPVDDQIFELMMEFAQATPEIGYTSTWYRQNVPPQIERIDSLVAGIRLTNKLDGIEAIYPEVIKYLVEASEIITGVPGNTSFLAGSECLSPPLIMESRSCEDMLERACRGVHRYHIASMPSTGVSMPVSVAGSIVVGAAELLAGEVAAWCLDPESDISGRMIALVTDLRSATPTSTGPEVAMINLGVRELFEARFGGHVWVEVFLGPCARRPGLQAVFENFFGAANYAKWMGLSDVMYPGMGALHNGGLGSPTQFMLDLDIRKAEWSSRRFELTDEALNFEEIRDRVEHGGDFLSSPHTLSHFREAWKSPLFLPSNPPKGNWDGTEKWILDKCDQMWRDNLAKYEPPVWPEEKLRALDALVVAAKKEFGIV